MQGWVTKTACPNLANMRLSSTRQPLALKIVLETPSPTSEFTPSYCNETYIFIEHRTSRLTVIYIRILTQRSYTAGLVHANPKSQTYNLSNAALMPSSAHSPTTTGTVLGSHPRAGARSPLTCWLCPTYTDTILYGETQCVRYGSIDY